jgi:hypothetical protein
MSTLSLPEALPAFNRGAAAIPNHEKLLRELRYIAPQTALAKSPGSSMWGRPGYPGRPFHFAEIQFQGLRACTKPLPQAALNSSAEILPSPSTSTM